MTTNTISQELLVALKEAIHATDEVHDNGCACLESFARCNCWLSRAKASVAKSEAAEIEAEQAALSDCREACRRIAGDAKESGGLEVTVGALEDAINAAKKFEK